MNPTTGLANGHAHLATTDLVSEAERILRERAHRYAEAPRDPTPEIDLLVLEIAGRRYGLETRVLGPVQRAQRLGLVPCAPPYVAGLLHVHGEVVTVLDLASLIGLESGGDRRGDTLVALIDLPHARVGLLVDSVVGMGRVAVDRVSPPGSEHDSQRPVAGDDLVILDVERLLSADRFSDQMEED